MPSPAFRQRLFCALLVGVGHAVANDFPTVDRVLYVQECMRTNPGPHYEMVNKCSCALDTLAMQVSFDEYTTMTTIANGSGIGGERGNAIRDTASLQPLLKRYRELQTQVKKSCFLDTPR